MKFKEMISSGDEDELDFENYFKILKKEWLWAIIGFLVVIGLTIAYVLLTTPVYEASTLILLTTQDQASFLVGGSAPKIADVETQKLIIQSPSVMNKIYQKYGVESFELSVDTIKNTDALQITVDAYTPENAMAIANDIALSFTDYTKGIQKRTAEDTIEFIDLQIAEYDQTLSSLNQELAKYESMALKTPAQNTEYQILKREINAKNKIYDDLLYKKEQSGLVESFKNGNVNVLSYAQLPEAPVRPNVVLSLLLGIILAISAGFGAAYIADKGKFF